MSGGPGQSHRQGMTLADLFRRFPNDEAAERYFVETRWPEGPHCPYCGSTNALSGAKHKTMPYRCREKECRKRFSVRTKSIMEGSNLGFQTWAIAIYLMMTSLKSVSSMKLHRDLGITQKSAWFLAHRLREAWERDEGPFLGPAEADETHVGGKLKNMHSDQRRVARDRFNYGKSIVAGVKDRATNKVSAAVVDDTTAETLQGFIEDRVVSDAKVYTDDGAAYRDMPFFDHETVNHSAGEYVRDDAGTQGIESFWSMFKRSYHGTFHHLSPKHLDRYVAEFAGRHNVRDADTIDQMASVVAGMVGKRLMYRDLIAG